MIISSLQECMNLINMHETNLEDPVINTLSIQTKRNPLDRCFMAFSLCEQIFTDAFHQKFVKESEAPYLKKNLSKNEKPHISKTPERATKSV